jgi:hypothetical protein
MPTDLVPGDRPAGTALLELSQRLLQSGMADAALRAAEQALALMPGESAAQDVVGRLREGRAADAATATIIAQDNEVLIPAAQRTSESAPRFVVPIPIDAIGQAELFEAATEELDGVGVDAELRNFLDAMLEPGDAFLDCDPGFGFSILAAATRHPGAVTVIARSADDDHAEFLEHALATNAIGTAAIERPVHGVPVTLDALAAHRLLQRSARFIGYLGQADDVESVLTGASIVLQDSRMAALAWAVTDDRTTASTTQALGRAGFAHFVIAADENGAVLVPADGMRGNRLIISVPARRIGEAT